jgi:hypothetical protein
MLIVVSEEPLQKFDDCKVNELAFASNVNSEILSSPSSSLQVYVCCAR